jgi:predicted MFS family arabinose efflux permease
MGKFFYIKKFTDQPKLFTCGTRSFDELSFDFPDKMAGTVIDTTIDQKVSSRSVATQWYVLFIMCLAYTISICDRYVMSTILENIRIDFNLTDTGVALLTGVSLALFYVSAGIPLSWLADRSNRRNILALSLLFWSVMTGFCGLSTSYLQLILARIGVGVGEAGGTPTANAIVGDYFTASTRPMAMTLFCLGAPIGAWLGADGAGALSSAYGWRAALILLAIPGVILGVIVYITIREPVRGRLDNMVKSELTPSPSFATTLTFLFQQKSALHLMMGSGVMGLWGWGILWFMPTYLQRAYGLSVGEAGAVLGPMHLVGGIGATLGTAWLLSRPAFGNPKSVVWLLAIGVTLGTPPSFMIFATHSLATAKIMLWLFMPAIYFYIGPVMGVVQNLAPANMRATVIALLVLIANLLSLVVAPAGVGMLSDFFAGPDGANAVSLRSALLILAPTGLWATVHYLLALKSLAADQARAIGHV